MIATTALGTFARGRGGSSGIRGGLAKIAGENGEITGIDPNTITRVYKFDPRRRSTRTSMSLGAFGVIVQKQSADDANLKVGDRFTRDER